MEKGKDFTSGKGDDNVYTPYSFPEQLLKREKFDYGKSVLEPASGTGSIVRVLKEKFDRVIHSDINLKNKKGLDFLEDYQKEEFAYIITNPPYSKLDLFIEQAKKVAFEKFAFLCKLTHLGSLRRFNNSTFLDSNYPLTKIYLYTRQSNLRFTTKEYEEKYKCTPYRKLREDKKYPAGMYYYCWLVFENIENYNSMTKDIVWNLYPQFKWINNQKYILSKKDIK